MPPATPSDMTAEELKGILATLGWSQAEAARQSGMGREYINALCNGRLKVKGLAAAFFRCVYKRERERTKVGE